MKKTVFLILALMAVNACSGIPKTVIAVDSSVIESFVKIDGAGGCENIHVDSFSGRVYVTDCQGFVYLLEGRTPEAMEPVKRIRIGEIALGISRGPDGQLYAGSAGKEWLKEGGAVCRLDDNLEGFTAVTSLYPGINGMVIDKTGILYFACGNLSLLNPKGKIYRINLNNGAGISPAEVFLDNLKSPNGINLSADGSTLVFSETFSGVRTYDFETGKLRKIFGRTRLVEGFDDVCTDSNGNYWAADQPNGFVKCYVTAENRVVYFRPEAAGVASSCRVAMFNGIEYLYVSEIRTSADSKEYDGRGIFIFDRKKLLALAGIQ